MSVGTNKHYRIAEMQGRHFLQTGEAAGVPKKLVRGWTGISNDECDRPGLAHRTHLVAAQCRPAQKDMLYIGIP